jgi:hypothetical protein
MVSILPHFSQLGSSLLRDLKLYCCPGRSIKDLKDSFSGFGGD